MTLLPLEVEQVVQRCWRRAKRWQAPPEWGREEWYEELLAHARAAAWAAYVAYDPARGVPLEVFLFAQVMGALRSYWRREWQEALHRATPPPLSEDEEESENWESALLSIRQEEKEWQQMVIRLALSQLSKRERLVIELLFWDRQTETDIAQELGISQQMVSKIKKRALEKLKEVLKEPPL
jgi:RNA polymerase sigma factor (sigma-70 family)